MSSSNKRTNPKSPNPSPSSASKSATTTTPNSNSKPLVASKPEAGKKKVYKYESPTVSIFFTLYWKPMYNWLCPRLFPSFLHPNILTLIGLFCAFSSFVLIGTHSAWFSNKDIVPGWAWVTSAFLFWGYMVADNCDGIQARRLGLSSPIGELLDHGLDGLVVSTPAQVLAFMYLGSDAESKVRGEMGLILICQYIYLMAHVISVLSGRLILGFKYISVDEMYLFYGGMLISEAFYPNLLNQFQYTLAPIPVLGFDKPIHVSLVNVAVTLFCVIPAIFGTIEVIRMILEKLSEKDEDGDPVLTVFDTLVYIVLPFILLFPAEYIGQPYDHLWMATFVPQFGLIALRLVLRRMQERGGPLPWYVTLPIVSFFYFAAPHLPQVVAVLPLAPRTMAAVTSVVLYFVSMGFIMRNMQRNFHVPYLFTVPREKRI